MNYSLGNMLGGAGAINPDKLALDLQFATDKTLTARKGPTPVFTRASTATFVGSDGLIQSAAINTARFDHDPITLACKGLLIEESRTNSLLRSDDFGDGVWNLGAQRNLTVSANNTASPSGATDADLLTVGATTTIYQVLQAGPTLTSGTTYTFSCYLKANQVTRVSLYSGWSATLPVDSFFDLTGDGAVTATASGTASIQKLSNGWYRCIVTGTAGASAATSLRISPATTGNSRIYVGNSVDSFWAWGAQLEVGSFATSYIPTTTASVVRSADVCSITGASFSDMYNATEGTVFADVIMPDVDQTAAIYYMNTSSGLNANTIFKLNAALSAAGKRWTYFSTNAAGVPQANITTPTDVAILRSKVASAYKINDFAFAHAGTIIGTDTSGTLPAPNQMGIGSRIGGAVILNGHISSLRYFRKRLPNAKLQTLTT